MNSDARRQIVEKARELGIECRKVIRPPLAPHRLGCKVRLIYPVNAEEALDSLRRSYSHQHRQGPSDRILDLLCNGDPAGRYKTRSEVVMAITAGWVNAALSKSSLTEALLNPRNFGGAKVREIASTQGIGAAERYVARGYDKAQTFVNRRPPIRRDTAINHILDQLLRAISSLSWRGLSGANDRCVLEAHLAIARNCSRSTYRASVREIAERAGLDSVSTVSRSHKRLIKRGILRLDKLAKVGIPDVWTLSVPKESGGTFLPHLGGVRQNVPAVSLNHDVWRYQALGHSTSLVWLELDPYRGRAAQEVARIRDLTVQTVRHHLAKLQKHGLVRRGAGELWLRVERDLDEVASELGTRGNGQRQRNRHVRERELFFNQLKRQTGRIGATQ
jgi:DNA-binding MarR family transcriptional regulator